MHHTTGFDREEIIDLCIPINSVQPGAGSPNWPPCLGLFKSAVAALTYMRHNRTQAEIGESLGVSQPTISRAISAVTPLVPEAMREFVPTADDFDPDAQYILDGTLLPCWPWDGHKELYSGKHKTTGMNLQVACTIYGKLAWISDPVNGSRHDNYCREESGVLLTINPRNRIGDKGYIGNNMITPFRKPAGGELLDWQKEYNSEVNKIRSVRSGRRAGPRGGQAGDDHLGTRRQREDLAAARVGQPTGRRSPNRLHVRAARPAGGAAGMMAAGGAAHQHRPSPCHSVPHHTSVPRLLSHTTPTPAACRGCRYGLRRVDERDLTGGG